MSTASYVVIAACVAAVIGLPDTQADELGDSAKTLELIAQRTEQNQRTFATFACRFRVASGMAPIIAEALRNGPVNPRFTADGIWIVRGAASTFELTTPKDSLVKAVQLASSNGVVNEVTLPFEDMKFIGNGRQQWFYTNHSAAGFGFIKRVKNQVVNFQTPFFTCLESEHQIGSAAQLIRHGLTRDSVRLLPPLSADTRNIHRVEYVEDSVGDESVKVVTLMQFDADRGYLPMEVSVGILRKPLGIRTIVVSAVQAANGAWYPQRSLELGNPETKTGPYSVKELVVTEMRLTVEDHDLRITIPQGTAIQDGKTQGAAPVLENDTVVTPDTLDKIQSGTHSSMIKFTSKKASGATIEVPQ